MVVSTSDIHSAVPLGSESTPGPSNHVPVVTGLPGQRKPAAARTGVSRELFSLIGDSAPPLVVNKPRFKQQPDIARTRVRWSLKSFGHASRSDALELKHWEKVTPASKQPQEYPFAKFGRPVTVYEYTEEEYNEFLEGMFCVPCGVAGWWTDLASFRAGVDQGRDRLSYGTHKRVRCAFLCYQRPL